MSWVPQFLSKIFQSKAPVLSWVWVPGDHVVDNKNNPLPPETDFGVGQDYVMLRLTEMYLETTRVLWKEFYPLVHSFVAYGDPVAQRSVATVAGPGQLKDLGTENLDRLINLSHRIAGPGVYDGH